MKTTVSHEQIAARAFDAYVSRGYRDGNAAEDWYRAESSLMHEASCSGEHGNHPAHGHSHHNDHEKHRHHGA